MSGDNSEELAILVRAFIDSSDFESALHMLIEAIELDPTDAQLYRLRAAVFRKMDRHEDALQDCELAIQLLPSGQSLLTGDSCESNRAAEANAAAEDCVQLVINKTFCILIAFAFVI